ncbi:hypothetical protein NDU88_001498 [Pleurodeles waltl]|uniref:Uncharacterized protein n=1 Tax=Pleurodeles waltl TaxID=8319 RepID=A0AAV7VWM7_PLEWA|nr:hypothetical protein NDU88_001498 [Pleurodeles waltl]
MQPSECGLKAEPASSSDGASGGGAWAWAWERVPAAGPERWRSRGAEGPGIVGLPGDLAGAVELKRPRAAWEVGSRSRAAGDGSRRGTQLESADDAYKIKDPRRRQEG